MISLSLEQFVFGFLVGGFLLVFSLWLYYDRRDRALFDRERLQRAYHCVRCGHLYAADDAEEAGCPKCHFRNARLKF